MTGEKLRLPIFQPIEYSESIWKNSNKGDEQKEDGRSQYGMWNMEYGIRIMSDNDEGQKAAMDG
ncbi:MAG: hypothetical protein CMP47_00020 [Rickettsiales bacterium]|nr:hypothetical protein [Rickettsiales bacterium]